MNVEVQGYDDSLLTIFFSTHHGRTRRHKGVPLFRGGRGRHDGPQSVINEDLSQRNGRETHTLPHLTQRVAMVTSPVKAIPPDDANKETKCTKCKKFIVNVLSILAYKLMNMSNFQLIMVGMNAST